MSDTTNLSRKGAKAQREGRSGRRIKGRKMKRGSTAKDTKQAKEKGQETIEPQMDTDAHR
jgi:hypothetical protein